MKAFHYAWIIAICAFLALLITNGLAIGGLPVFDKQILGEMGWSVGGYKLGALITFAIAGICGPFIGGIADRHGVRRLMILGSLLLAAGLFGYSQVQSQTHLYLAHAVFGVALACAGLVVSVMLVSRWFVEKRGTAIGLTLVGTSMGTIVFAKVNVWIMLEVGWREAFQWISLFPLVLIPVILGVIREWPKDRGLLPYGGKPAAESKDGTGAASGEMPGVPFSEAIRSRDFWALALVAMTSFYVVLAAFQHVPLHLGRTFELDAKAASSGLAVLGLMALIGKFLLGWLSDRLEPKLVLIGGLVVMLVGSLGLASMSSGLLWPTLVLFGLGWGGLYTMIQLLIVLRFGIRDSGKILGTITVLDALGGGLGPFITGVLWDQTGSYQLPFAVMAGLLVVALVLSVVALSSSHRVAAAAGAAS